MNLVQATSTFTTAIRDKVGIEPNITVSAKSVGTKNPQTMFIVKFHGELANSPLHRMLAINAIKDEAKANNSLVDWR
jgi:hypothetical protein